MPIPEWEFNTDAPSDIFWTLDIATPIDGTGSLLFQYATSVPGTINAIPSDSLYPVGVTSGKLRTLFSVRTLNGSTPSNLSYLGILAMQENRDVTGTGSAESFYALAVSLPEGLGTVTLMLLKGSGLGNLEDLTVLDTMIYPDPVTVGSTHALEFQWISDSINLNGTFLVARTGTEIDFSDLEPQLLYMDFDTPLTTTVGEGLFAYFKGSGTNLKQFTYDSTILYELV